MKTLIYAIIAVFLSTQAHAIGLSSIELNQKYSGSLPNGPCSVDFVTPGDEDRLMLVVNANMVTTYSFSLSKTEIAQTLSGCSHKDACRFQSHRNLPRRGQGVADVVSLELYQDSNSNDRCLSVFAGDISNGRGYNSCVINLDQRGKGCSLK